MNDRHLAAFLIRYVATSILTLGSPLRSFRGKKIPLPSDWSNLVNFLSLMFLILLDFFILGLLNILHFLLFVVHVTVILSLDFV